MNSSPPAVQFYVKDFLCDLSVMLMTASERGAYWFLLMCCWLEGSIPNDPELLTGITKATKDEVANCLRQFVPCPADGTRLVHPYLEQQRERQQAFREAKSQAGRASGEARRTRKREGVVVKPSLPSQITSAGVGPDAGFDGDEWALRTLKQYPSWADPDAIVVPPSLGNLYMQVIEREQERQGGVLRAAEWFMGVVQEYARQHLDGQYIMSLEKFLRHGYAEVKPAEVATKYVPPESDEECEARLSREARERRRQSGDGGAS